MYSKNLLTLLVIFYTTTCFLVSAVAQNKRPPNIIYIYADDLGYGELGCYGQSIIQTPHLDRMAREGMRFTQHYSSAPVCAPARCMLMTGKHPGHSYIRGNYELGGFEDELEGGQMPLHEGAYTIAGMLKEKGYVEGSLYFRIDKAATDHLITSAMAKWAHRVRLDANDQRHADMTATLPTQEDAKRSIQFTKALAEFLFVLPAQVEAGLAATQPNKTF